MLDIEEKDIHISINKNGTPLKVIQTEENKYDLYFWVRMQMYNGAYLWSFRGNPENYLTWNAKLLMPSKEATVRQAQTILKYLNLRPMMQSFVTEDYQTQTKYPYNSTSMLYQYTFPWLPRLKFGINDSYLKIDEIIQKVNKGIFWINKVIDLDKTYDLYLPQEVDLAQKSAILELLLNKNITIRRIYLWQGNKFDLLTGHPLQNINFSTDPENTLTLKKPY